MTPAGRVAHETSPADDLVGVFHSGHQINNRPQSLSEFRVTTGDPDVAARIHDLLGGEAPQEWETKSERNLEQFTNATSVEVIVDKPSALRQRMILWGNDRKPVYISDGAFILDEQGHRTDKPDPDANLTFQERKDKRTYGANPSIELTFRLADDPDLGLFQIKSGSWGLARYLAAEDIEGQLAAIDGPALVRIALVPESFTPVGDMTGRRVRYTATVIEVLGAAVSADPRTPRD